MVVNAMWGCVTPYIDLGAIFDPPACCTAAQIQDCEDLAYKFQYSLVTALDQYINIRYREHGRLVDYPSADSFDAAGKVFFGLWKSMPTMETFPATPRIEDFSVASIVVKERKRARVDHAAPAMPPRPPRCAPATLPHSAPKGRRTAIIGLVSLRYDYPQGELPTDMTPWVKAMNVEGSTAKIT